MTARAGREVALGGMRMLLGLTQGSRPTWRVKRRAASDTECALVALSEPQALVASEAKGLGAVAGLAVVGPQGRVGSVSQHVVGGVESQGAERPRVTVGAERLGVAGVTRSRVGLRADLVVFDEGEVVRHAPRRAFARNERGQAAIVDHARHEASILRRWMARPASCTGLDAIVARQALGLAGKLERRRQSHGTHVPMAIFTRGTLLGVQSMVEVKQRRRGPETGGDAAIFHVGVARRALRGRRARTRVLGTVTTVADGPARKVVVVGAAAVVDRDVACLTRQSKAEMLRVIELERNRLGGIDGRARARGAPRHAHGRRNLRPRTCACTAGPLPRAVDDHGGPATEGP